MNKIAIKNVRTHLVVQTMKCEEAKKKAENEHMTDTCIQMHEDSAKIYSELLEYVNEKYIL